MSAENELRVGFVRLSALGDIVHSLGVLPFLKDALVKGGKKVQFTWFVDSSFVEIVRDCPYIDELVELPLQKAFKTRNFGLLKSIKESLKKYKFDIVIDMQGLLKSALVARLLNSSCKVGFSFFSAREGLASFFYNKKIKISYKDHVLNRGAAVAFGAFDLPAPPLVFLQNPPPFLSAKKLNQSEIESQKNKGLAEFFASKIKVLCILKTSQVKKNYPAEKFLELARLLCEVLNSSLINGEEADKKGDIKPFFLTQKEPRAGEITTFAHNLYGLNLTQIKSIISECDLVIGGDTGFSHLAWGFGVPSLTLFSNVWKRTNRERTELKRPQNRALEAIEFSALSAESVCKEANELLNAKINSKRDFALDSIESEQKNSMTASQESAPTPCFKTSVDLIESECKKAAGAVPHEEEAFPLRSATLETSRDALVLRRLSVRSDSEALKSCSSEATGAARTIAACGTNQSGEDSIKSIESENIESKQADSIESNQKDSIESKNAESKSPAQNKRRRRIKQGTAESSCEAAKQGADK